MTSPDGATPERAELPRVGSRARRKWPRPPSDTPRVSTRHRCSVPNSRVSLSRSSPRRPVWRPCCALAGRRASRALVLPHRLRLHALGCVPGHRGRRGGTAPPRDPPLARRAPRPADARRAARRARGRRAVVLAAAGRPSPAHPRCFHRYRRSARIVAVLPLRAGAPKPAAYGGPEIAAHMSAPLPQSARRDAVHAAGPRVRACAHAARESGGPRPTDSRRDGRATRDEPAGRASRTTSSCAFARRKGTGWWRSLSRVGGAMWGTKPDGSGAISASPAPEARRCRWDLDGVLAFRHAAERSQTVKRSGTTSTADRERGRDPWRL